MDTECKGESFLVRHVYFTGEEEPYERLKRALRAEVNESAWASLYGTTSLSFACSATGKIAVKVINFRLGWRSQAHLDVSHWCCRHILGCERSLPIVLKE